MKSNYSVRRCTQTTASLAIESRTGLDPLVKAEIRLFHPSGWSLLSKLDEAVIGRAEGHTCALVCRIRQNDVIGTREVFISGEAVWSYYRIDASFRPVILFGETHSPNQVDRDVLKPVNVHASLADDSDEVEIRRFFSQRHPVWLQTIVDRQIAQWRDSNPDRFFRFAPRALLERGLDRCVDEAPFAALARFKELLTEAQIRKCVLRSPRGAVIHALEHVTGQMRVTYLVERASEALFYSYDNLTDKELGRCAWIDVETGFHLRERLPPHRRAIALANSYPFCFLKSPDEMAEVHREIHESMIAFPDQWEASETGGFAAVFHNLENRIGWQFNTSIYAEIMRRVPTSEPTSLQRFLAGMI